MALPDLADASDLSARGVEPTDDEVAATYLAVASSVVRGAARSPIAQTTSTVSLWAQDRDVYLDLPGKPVSAVSSVVLDGITLAATDYRLIHGRLWRRCGWADEWDPKEAVVTMTHGLSVVPPWVVQLVCDVAIAGMNAAQSGARDPRVVVESIDDYSVTFTSQGQIVATAVELPTATKMALRAAFGGGGGMTTSR